MMALPTPTRENELIQKKAVTSLDMLGGVSWAKGLELGQTDLPLLFGDLWPPSNLHQPLHTLLTIGLMGADHSKEHVGNALITENCHKMAHAVLFV